MNCSFPVAYLPRADQIIADSLYIDSIAEQLLYVRIVNVRQDRVSLY